VILFAVSQCTNKFYHSHFEQNVQTIFANASVHHSQTPHIYVKVKGKVFPVHVIKAYRRRRRAAPFIYKLGMVNLTPLPPYLRERTRFSINKSLGRPQRRFGRFWRI